MNIKNDSRFVSRLTRQTLALILAGGRGSRLYELTDWRAKPGVPFAGKFRIIDFPLSNCVNSGIRRIGVLTQYKAHSLIRHLVRGWSTFLRPELGEFMEILPASQRTGEEWYTGTADAVYQNLDIINTYQPEYVLILSGDHIYKMDYGNMLAFHAEQRADLTVACLEVPIDEARGAFGVMTADAENRILRFDEKPQNPSPIPGRENLTLASMGNYVFNTQFLYEQLRKDAENSASKHDFGINIIPSLIDDYRLFAYPFRDQSGKQTYWRDVGTVDAFWKAHMELLDPDVELDLHDQNWPILTDQQQLPPAKFVVGEGEKPSFVDSMASGGCVIAGAQVLHSLLFSDVRVHAHAQVEESVLLPEVEVSRHCRIHKAILDRGCHIPEGMVIGEDSEEDAKRFRVTAQGVVLVTRDMLGQKAKYYVR